MPRHELLDPRQESFPLIDERKETGWPIRLILDSRVRVRRRDLTEGQSKRLQAEFEYANPDRARWDALRKARVRVSRVAPPESVGTWEARIGPEGELSFPRGGLARVVRALGGGERVRIDDRRTAAGELDYPSIRFELRADFVPFDHQIAMVDAAERAETCLLRAPTGSGKTAAAFLLAARLGLWTLVLTPTEVIFDQWVASARDMFGLSGRDVGKIKGPNQYFQPLTIASVKTFAKGAERFADAFGLVIFDEAHLAAAPTLYAAVDPLRARYRIGITADERRKDKKEFFVRDAFGPVAIDVSRSELIDLGVIVDTEIRLVPTTFEAPWYLELEGAARASNETQDRLISEMTANEDRNDLAARWIELSMSAGPTLAFTHRVGHALRLVQKTSARLPGQAGLCVGEQPEQRAETIAAIRAGTKRCGIGTYDSIGTGADLPSVERGVCVTPVHTNRPRLGQVRGRVCRQDRSAGATKTGSVLYVLWDERVFGVSPLRAFVSWAGESVKVLRAGRPGDFRDVEFVDGREELRRLDEEREDARREADESIAFLLG